VSSHRKAGQPAYRKPQLRLVPSPDNERKPSELDPALKEVLDDMRRRYRVQRERTERGPDDRDAA
jgi:hypothetical protein